MSQNPNPLSQRSWLSLQSPAQYLGGELNSVLKCNDEVDVHFALCFPDTYEVGMSHLGLQVLYDLLNREDFCWAERVFAPAPDMDNLLHFTSASLCSLESKRPLSEFDVLGFTLQYELCATTVLSMLDRGNIPLRSSDRTDEHPLVLGGGPWAYHPEAIADFFDAFFLGDAEEAIPEILAIIREETSSRTRDKENLLRALDTIEGVYVPALFEPQLSENGILYGIRAKNAEKPLVRRRVLANLDSAPYPLRPLVPNVDCIHDRLNIEVMRGCVRGCRFCQAGYTSRPHRERSPETVMKIIQDSLGQTGHDELSLLSLSTADYTCALALVKELMDSYAEQERVSISLPSTRVDALSSELLEQIARVRRTGFTIAPEGGSQRLRNLINKGLSDEQILDTIQTVFERGWSAVKLYFMIGLPTETDEDLKAIVELAKAAKQLPVAARKDITVSVSTHVPKPHTAFQWAEQISPDETIRRQEFLRDGLKRTRVSFRTHDPYSSFIEGVLCRAGRELSAVIQCAYELGCRLDAWNEHFDESLWLRAFSECEVDPYQYLEKKNPAEPLPWDHLSSGVDKSYLERELRRALCLELTPECLGNQCSNCGVCDHKRIANSTYSAEKFVSSPRAQRTLLGREPVSYLRLRYSKQGSLIYTGHLALSRIFQRASRRCALPLCYSKGFHPMPRLSFGPPLQLGISSSAEYLDMALYEHSAPEEVTKLLNDSLPIGLRALEAHAISPKEPSIQKSIRTQSFRVLCRINPMGIFSDIAERLCFPDSSNTLDKQLELEALKCTVRRTPERSSKRRRQQRAKTKEFVLGEYLQKMRLCGSQGNIEDNIRFEFTLLADATRPSPRPLEIVRALSELEPGDFDIEKTQVTFDNNPLDIQGTHDSDTEERCSTIPH